MFFPAKNHEAKKEIIQQINKYFGSINIWQDILPDKYTNILHHRCILKCNNNLAY